jgi:uncharacterized protein YuzE
LIFEEPDELHLSYDEEADVLYLSLGNPRPALGLDLGEMVLRYDEEANEVRGFTFTGIGALLEELSNKSKAKKKIAR